MNEVEERYKEKGSITVKVTMPLLAWEEWNADCERYFGGTRYLKMMNDHEFRLNLNSISGLIIDDLLQVKDDINQLKSEILLLNQTEPVQEKTKTFGGKQNG